MRLDYHIHLEFDDYNKPIRLDMARLRRYAAQAQARGLEEFGISEHCYRFREFAPVFAPLLQGAEVWPENREFFGKAFSDSLAAYVAFLTEAQQEGIPVKIGLEVDFIPATVETIAAIVKQYPWDYLLGSVHFLRSFPVDASPQLGWPDRAVDATYDEYFQTWQQACKCGLFDIMAHPDLLKKFGHRPSRVPDGLYRDAAQAARQADVAIEISSAGLRKPVAEIYPGMELLQAFHAAQVPIALGSDAHCAEDVGLQLTDTVAWAQKAGYNSISRFRQRQREQVPIS